MQSASRLGGTERASAFFCRAGTGFFKYPHETRTPLLPPLDLSETGGTVFSQAAIVNLAVRAATQSQLPPQPSKQMDMLQHLVAGGQYASFVARAPQASAV